MPRTAFVERFNHLMVRTGHRIHTDFDWSNLETRRFPAVGITHERNLGAIAAQLSAGGFRNVTEFSTAQFKGIYFLDSKSDLPGLIFSPKTEIIATDTALCNQDRDSRSVFQLQRAGERLGIEDLRLLDFSSALPLWIGDDRVSAAHLGIKEEKYAEIKFGNSMALYEACYLGFLSDPTGFMFLPPDSPNYSHISTFSRIYYQTIAAMARMRGESTDPATVHDAGTCVAQLPLLLRKLQPERLFGLEVSQVLASDIEMAASNNARNFIDQLGLTGIEFATVDLTDQGQNIAPADFIVCNDVLEHMPSDRASFELLQRLVGQARVGFIGHVPFEATPNPAWDHFVTFDAARIQRWQERVVCNLGLPADAIISNQMHEYDGRTLTDHGFFIIRTA